MTTALIFFGVVYLLLIALPKYRAPIAVAGALVFVFSGILPVSEMFSAIDWNVILMIAGTMGIVFLFIESKMPSRLADLLIGHTKTMTWMVIVISVFAGVISAFVDNVSTVLMVAPVAVTISKKLKISPVPMVIAIAIASNLEGSATLVGDTTSIMLAGAAKMDFLDFFWMNGRPGLFWINQAGLLSASATLYFHFRKYRHQVSSEKITEVKDYFPTYLLLGMIVLLVAASFFPNKPAITNGLICVVLMMIGLVYYAIRDKNAKMLKEALKNIDYYTLLLLAALFIIIAAIERAGVISELAKVLVKTGGHSVFVMYSILLWLSVALSAVIDNIPYVATMLPVVASIASSMGIEPHVLYFGLICGATLGGNISPIGASANIAGLGILRKEGHEVSNMDFVKISVPYTLAAVLAAYVLVWLFWA